MSNYRLNLLANKIKTTQAYGLNIDEFVINAALNKWILNEYR